MSSFAIFKPQDTIGHSRQFQVPALFGTKSPERSPKYVAFYQVSCDSGPKKLEKCPIWVRGRNFRIFVKYA